MSSAAGTPTRRSGRLNQSADAGNDATNAGASDEVSSLSEGDLDDASIDEEDEDDLDDDEDEDDEMDDDGLPIEAMLGLEESEEDEFDEDGDLIDDDGIVELFGSDEESFMSDEEVERLKDIIQSGCIAHMREFGLPDDVTLDLDDDEEQPSTPEEFCAKMTLRQLFDYVYSHDATNDLLGTEARILEREHVELVSNLAPERQARRADTKLCRV